MIFCAISRLIAIRDSFTFTMTFPPMVLITVTALPTTNPRFSKWARTCGFPPIFRIILSSPTPASVSGIIVSPSFKAYISIAKCIYFFHFWLAFANRLLLYANKTVLSIFLRIKFPCIWNFGKSSIWLAFANYIFVQFVTTGHAWSSPLQPWF